MTPREDVIAELCAIAGRCDLAEDLVASEMSADQVRGWLLRQAAAAPPPPQTREELGSFVRGYWADRRHR